MDDRLMILTGDAMEKLATLPDGSVHCCVTSPPYWGLRDYGTAQWEGGNPECDHKQGRNGSGRADGIIDERGQRNRDGVGSMGGDCKKCGAKRIDNQIGLEKTPEEYLAKMVAVFREVKRVLRFDGTCWVNMGDSYIANGGGGERRMIELGNPSTRALSKPEHLCDKKRSINSGLKPKDLCGIPWRLAFALQADGWYLRSDIIWHKPNPMPESVTDRPTKSHEYIFLLSKSERYFYDAEAIKEPVAYPDDVGRIRNGRNMNGCTGVSLNSTGGDSTRNKRSVWTVPTQCYPESHFATFPEDLIKPCILAGTSARGCCPKCGAPLIRVTEPTPEYAEKLKHANDRGDWYARSNIYEKRIDGTKQGKLEGGIRSEYKTIDWQPTCQHGEDPIPCTVLDPFGGSGTTGQVSLELGRKAILIELNPEYVKFIKKRCDVTFGLPLA